MARKVKKAKLTKKAKVAKNTRNSSPSMIVQFGGVFVIVAAIVLIAYAVKNFS